MKILVAGGSGFLGSYVVDELVGRGHDVTIFDLRESPFKNPKASLILGDVMDKRSVQNAISGHDVVYNFAGLADLNDSIDKPVETVTLNVMGNLNLLEGCRIHGISRFVYASTVYVFSRKGAFYGASKKSSELIIEQYAENYQLPYTIIRYGSVYGERGDSTNRIYRIIREALTQKSITFQGDGTEEREYIHGRDAAVLSVDVLDEKFRDQNVTLSGLERLSYKELLGILNEMMNGEVDIRMRSEEYQGHYVLTPYSFAPTVGVKLVNNPSIEFGQGLLECIEHVYNELQEEGELEPDMITRASG